MQTYDLGDTTDPPGGKGDEPWDFNKTMDLREEKLHSHSLTSDEGYCEIPQHHQSWILSPPW